MRLSPGFLFAVVLAGCTSASATATDGGTESGGVGGQGVMTDAPPANSCEMYAPTGSVCRGSGVCGIGYALSQFYLCAESAEVCCSPAIDGGVLAGDASGGGDAKVVEAGHDATMTGHDAGHDSGVTMHVDAGHDSGMTMHTDAGHDAGHDSGMTMHMDAGHDAGHDSGASDAQDGATD